MKKIILIRYGEIFLKGNNRRYFERLLESNIRKAVEGCGAAVRAARTRYEIEAPKGGAEDIIARLQKVSGISSVSIAYKCPSDFLQIKAAVIAAAPDRGTFRITANRADKLYPHDSVYIARELGAYVLEQKPALKVDLHNADADINVDIREDKTAYVFAGYIRGAGCCS